VWTNWAGNQQCSPASVAHPFGTDELSAVVGEAARRGQRVKVAGHGHSFTDIACTDGTLVLLDRHRRTLALDRDRARITVEAGMTLHELGTMLWLYGLALPNLGDIDTQTVAGALATGTHGTGSGHRCIAAQAVGIELVTAGGDVLQLDPQHDAGAFSAAQVSLGALGAVSTVTLQCVPSFNLHADEGPMRIEEAVERFDELAEANEHFEFFWMPFSPWAIVKRNNPAEGPRRGRSRSREWLDDMFVQNHLFGALCQVEARFPKTVPWLNAHLLTPSHVEYVDRSDRVFTTPRKVKFQEMEYGFPRAHARSVVEEVRRIAMRAGVGFPIEVRVCQGDDIPLSMASERDSCFVAVHLYRGQPYEHYFRDVEAVMREVGGRPHWGKLHFQDASDLKDLYPRWQQFQDVRDRLDPEGVFANAYTDRVLGQTSGQG
jgi:L-gulonolactone oxidase